MQSEPERAPDAGKAPDDGGILRFEGRTERTTSHHAEHLATSARGLEEASPAQVHQKRKTGSISKMVPNNIVRPAENKYKTLAQLMSDGIHRTDPIPLSGAVALVEAGVMRMYVPVASELGTADDFEFSSSDAAGLCLRILSAVSVQADSLLNELEMPNLRRTTASDFAESSLYALRRGGAQSIQLCSLISSAAKLDYPELHAELLVVGVLDSLANSLAAMTATSGKFPRVAFRGHIRPNAYCSAAPKASQGFDASGSSKLRTWANNTSYPGSENNISPSRELCKGRRPNSVAASDGMRKGVQAVHHSSVPKLALQSAHKLAVNTEASYLGITRSTRRILAGSNRQANRDLLLEVGDYSSKAIMSSTTSGTQGSGSDGIRQLESDCQGNNHRKHQLTIVSNSNPATQGSAHARESSRCDTRQSVTGSAAREFRSMSRNSGEALLMADVSGILAHNRRCRPDTAFTKENVKLTKAGVYTVSTRSCRTSAKFVATASSGREAPSENRKCMVLDAMKSLSSAGFCSSQIRKESARCDWESVNSNLSVDDSPIRLMSALSAMLCAHNIEGHFKLDASMRDRCMSILVAYWALLRHRYPDAIDPLILRLRGHVHLIHATANVSSNLVTIEEEENLEGMLRLMGDYLEAARNLGQGDHAVVAEVLAHARSIFVVGAAGSQPAQWRAQRLRAADAWFGAASAILSRVIDDSDNSLSAEMFVSLLLAQKPTLAWVYEYSNYVLFSKDAHPSPSDSSVHGNFGAVKAFTAEQLVAARVQILSYFTFLIKLVVVAFPPDKAHDINASSESGNIKIHVDSRVLALLSHLDFIMKPTTGFVAKILGGVCASHTCNRATKDGFVDGVNEVAVHCSARATSMQASESLRTLNFGTRNVCQPPEVCTAALLLAETAFSAPSMPFLASRSSTDTHVHNHFVSLLRLYNTFDRDGAQLPGAWADLVTGHLQVLIAMARAEDRISLSNNIAQGGGCPQEQQQIKLTRFVAQSANHIPPDSDYAKYESTSMRAVDESFRRLRLVDFIVREIDLESEVSKRMSRGKKELNTSSSEPPTQLISKDAAFSTKSLALCDDGISTCDAQNLNMMPLESSKDHAPVLSLHASIEQNVSISGTALKNSTCTSKTAEAYKHKGPTIPKLNIKLAGRSDGLSKTLYPNIQSDDTHVSDDDQMTRGFIGDLMEDVEREEALEEREAKFAARTVPDEAPGELLISNMTSESHTTDHDEANCNRNGESPSDASIDVEDDSSHRRELQQDAEDFAVNESFAHVKMFPISDDNGEGVCEAYSVQSHDRGMNDVNYQSQGNKSKSRSSGLRIADEALQVESAVEILYRNDLKKRRIYCNEGVHVGMLVLLLASVVRAGIKGENGDISRKIRAAGGIGKVHSYPMNTTQLQLQNFRQNVTFLLRKHLNHTHNSWIIAQLTSSAAMLGKGAERLLRLSCDALFRPERYVSSKLVARGAYAQVHCCSLPSELGTFFSSEVALKIIDAPQNTHDLASAVNVYSEIAVFEAMAREPCVAKVFDYGVARESFYIVMQQYPASLKQWRTAHSDTFDATELVGQAPMYANIYAECIEAVCAIQKYGVVHYDVKADNFLLEPLPGCSWDEFWNPRKEFHKIPFRVVITDFGESRMFRADETAGTGHNRGTEYIKSPEMLTITNGSKKDVKSYDRRKFCKCGPPSDVWALGCLLYEILTNSFM